MQKQVLRQVMGEFMMACTFNSILLKWSYNLVSLSTCVNILQVIKQRADKDDLLEAGTVILGNSKTKLILY